MPILSFLVLFFCVNLAYSQNEFKLHSVSPDDYKALLLAEVSTGKVLLEDRGDDIVIPASLVKMMVSLIVLERIELGVIKFTDEVVTSRWASKIGGHQVYLKQGEVFTIGELMKAIVIFSANDATVAIAEYLEGNQKAFVSLMNKRAKELGMNNTEFHNPHGLPPGRGQKDNKTTAYDLMLLGKELIKYPQYLKWSSTQLDYFRDGKFQLLNTNRKLLRMFPEVDGLKTGYHRKAGFSVVATAEKKGMRLIAAVIGTRRVSIRNKITMQLLKKGFNSYQVMKIVEKGENLKSIPVVNGLKSEIQLTASNDLKFLIKYTQKDKLQPNFQIPDKVLAPIIAGTPIGHVEWAVGERVMGEVDLLAKNDVKQKQPPSFWKKLKNTIKGWFSKEDDSGEDNNL